jgi:hypothetical protein
VVTLPIALLVVIYGGSNVGHLIAGFLGVLLIGAAVAAMGTFYSSLTKTQLAGGSDDRRESGFFSAAGLFLTFYRPTAEKRAARAQLLRALYGFREGRDFCKTRDILSQYNRDLPLRGADVACIAQVALK